MANQPRRTRCGWLAPRPSLAPTRSTSSPCRRSADGSAFGAARRREAVDIHRAGTQEPSFFVDRPCVGAHFIEQALHAPAQAVHLIDEMQDHRDAFIVDAEVLTQIANELGAREV